MKYLIKPKRGTHLYNEKKNYGEIFYDGSSHFKLNIIAPKSQREMLKVLFIDLCKVLSEDFMLIEPIERRGSAKGITSVSKSNVSADDLMEMLKEDFPGLKLQIADNKEYLKKYSQTYKRKKKGKDVI